MLHIRMLGPFMLLFLLCDADSRCPEPNPLTLNPPRVIGKYGESVFVNCTTTIEDHEGISWQQSGDMTQTEEWITYIYKPIHLTLWNVTAECQLQLSDNVKCSKNLDITVYKNPDAVTMLSKKHEYQVKEGTLELQCHVLEVAPVRNLIVRWFRDNQTIQTDPFTDTTKAAVNVSSTLKVNISRDDEGAQFRCEAQLDFGPHGAQPPHTSETRRVSVQYRPELKNKTDTDIFVNEGDDVTLNCEAEGNPSPDYVWTCDGKAIPGGIKPHLNITQVNASVTCNCLTVNNMGAATKQIRVHVMTTTKTTAQAAMTTPGPKTIAGYPMILSPAEAVVRFGDPVSILCSTPATGFWGMGWESAVGGVALRENVTAVNWTVEKLEEWDIQPQCFITLNNNLQFFKLPNITVYKTPDLVSVSVLGNGSMMEGRDYLLSCDIIDVAPEAKLNVTWYRGNETVHSETFSGTSAAPVNLSSMLRITADHNAAQFRCEAKLHLGPKGPEQVPTVTSLPYVADVLYKPVLEGCSSHYTGVEHQIHLDMLSCQANGNPPPSLQWYYQGEPINGSEPLTRDHSGSFGVEAVNRLGSSSTYVTVTIEYGPSVSCGVHYEVEEGDQLQPSCKPDGVPEPLIELVNTKTGVASPQRWTKHDSGQYFLKALNKHGEASQMVYVDVLYAPVFKEGNVTVEVTLGENVTFDCQAEGNPAPEVGWSSTSAVSATTGGRQSKISVTGATSTDAGVYICSAVNKVGRVTRSVTLVMKGKTIAGPLPLLWWLLILLIILLIIIIIMMIVRSQWKKHGRYSFIPNKPRDGSDIPMTPQSNGVQP